MKVYLVFHCNDLKENLIGVYKTIEVARMAINEHKKYPTQTPKNDNYIIHGMEVVENVFTVFL